MRTRPLALVLVAACAASLVTGLSETLPIAALALAVACVWASSELAVEGFEGVCVSLGLSTYVAGVASSLASNLPEVVLAWLMASSPHLREVAAVMVVLAAAFNSILLGLLVISASWSRGAVKVPRAALTVEAEAMRMGAVVSALYALVGLLAGAGGGRAVLPKEAAVFPLVAYVAYALILQRREAREKVGASIKRALLDAAIGAAGVVASSELVSSVAEHWVVEAGLNPVLAATVLAFSASVPEHAVALVSAKRGRLEMGLSNVISGVVQSVLLVFPLIALATEVVLDGFVIYQLAASAAMLWIVEKAITDDELLTVDEGLFITLVSLLGVLLLDELSFMI